MGFAKPIEQYLFGNLLIRIHGFMYLKDIIRGDVFMEKAYKTMTSSGAANIAAGIVVIVAGVAAGVLTIINGARLLKNRNEIIF
jgi:hypothetical protein